MTTSVAEAQAPAAPAASGGGEGPASPVAPAPPVPTDLPALLEFPSYLPAVDASAYPAQLAAKAARVRALFAGIFPEGLELSVFDSPPEGYRMRADFGVVREDDGKLAYRMYEAGTGGRAQARKLKEQQGPAGEGRGADGAAEAKVGNGADGAVEAKADAGASPADASATATLAAEQNAGEPNARRKKRDKKRKAMEIKPRVPVRVSGFPIGSALMNELMALLLPALEADEELRTRLFQASFHTTLTGRSMVTLTYHRKLAEDVWMPRARELAAKLAEAPLAAETPIVIGRSRGQALCTGPERRVLEALTVRDRTLQYHQAEGAFSQPNARTAEKMLAWALGAAQRAGERGDFAARRPAADGDASAATARDLLELYCGNGNFTVAVAPAFRRVVATELSKPGVEAARENLALNGVENVFVARMRSEEFVEAWRDGRPRQRLEGLDLKGCDFGTLLVDPPRAGLDPDTLALASEFDAIIYVSCNPSTLRENVVGLRETHEVVEAAMFDQFPWTPHMEMGVYLRRRPEAGPGPAGGVQPGAEKAAEEAKKKREEGEVKTEGDGEEKGEAEAEDKAEVQK